MKKCDKCLFPETYETIVYNEKNECNICASNLKQKEEINWNIRKKELDKIISNYRGKYDYDCIIPYSGGKDSTFQLYYLINEYKIKPLVIRFNHGFYRNQTNINSENALKKLGADFLEFTPNWHIVKNLMLESFKRKGDFCWHCHTGIYSFPIRVAVKFNVPLVIYGEPLAEMSAYYSYKEKEEEDEEKFNMVRNLGINAEDMYNMLKGSGVNLDKRDLLPYSYPEKKEFLKAGIKSILLGTYIKWDYKKQVDIIKKELNWKGDELEGVPSNANPFDSKIECFMQGTRDYIKFVKRGYGRITQNLATEIRENRISTNEAKKIINKNEGKKPHSLKLFLDYVGLKENEFNKILKPMLVYTYNNNFKKKIFSKKTKDFSKWYKEK